ncbi:NARE ribosyltransferase, partial [Dasyornis broadbenti]|nr:NARE ribosyltransferase [Dasyornis broadbenti]
WPLPSMAPLAHTLALLAMTVATVAIEVLPLDMVPDSFDDQYQGCRDKMIKELQNLSRSEFQQNPDFAQGWENAMNVWRMRGSPVFPPLSSDHSIALLAYTMKGLYTKFNKAVREAGRSPQEYRNNFHFKTLHFLLTDALAKLRDKQKPKRRCVYHRVDGVQFQAQPGSTVRFGHFALTLLCKGEAGEFGMGTTFQVYTQHGVDIQTFSYYQYKEEVLIPPFETFNVTRVIEDGDKVTIELNSTGTHSNFNCEWLRGDAMGRVWGHG